MIQIFSALTGIHNANKFLTQGKFSGRKIEIYIGFEHETRNAICFVCSMTNFSRNDNTAPQNRITNIGVNGFDEQFTGYDMYKDFEINDMDYWSYFADAKIAFTDHVKYEDARMTCSSDAEKIGTYLEGKFTGCLKYERIYACENAVHNCWIELPVVFDENRFISSGKYSSTIDFVEAVRNEMNEYWKKNPDNELLKYRVNVMFYMVNGDVWGSFSNFIRDDKYNLIERFAAVDYDGATVEELIGCKGIIEVDVQFWELGDVIKLVENMPDLKYIKGIRYVKGVDDAKLAELSQKYGNIVFD